MRIGIVWFRQDLRLRDNPALFNAVKECDRILLIYILDDRKNPWKLGRAQKWWLHRSLEALSEQLQKKEKN